MENNNRTITLQGFAAIEYAESHGLTLCKYNDPTEGARTDLTPQEARAVAREDPRLIYFLLTLTQEPYLDQVHVRINDTVEAIDGTVYRAAAVDKDGNEYQVYWTKVADGEVTDWDTYTVLEA